MGRRRGEVEKEVTDALRYVVSPFTKEEAARRRQVCRSACNSNRMSHLLLMHQSSRGTRSPGCNAKYQPVSSDIDLGHLNRVLGLLHQEQDESDEEADMMLSARPFAVDHDGGAGSHDPRGLLGTVVGKPARIDPSKPGTICSACACSMHSVHYWQPLCAAFRGIMLSCE